MALTITYDVPTNTITATGPYTNMVFSQFYTADIAGTRSLYVGPVGMNITLTTQIKPAEMLALLIDFILSGSDAGAGDTIEITGTDKDDNPQTETLDVSAGDGTYTTTKWFRTITDVDCVGFAMGALTIRQNRWGVVWWRGDDVFRFSARLILNNLTFTDKEKLIYFDADAATGNSQVLIRVGSGQSTTFTAGVLTDESTKSTKQGILFMFDNPGYLYGRFIGCYNSSATANLYSCSFITKSPSYLYDAGLGISGRIWNAVLCRTYLGGDRTDGTTNVIDAYRITTSDARYGFVYGMTGTMNDILILKANEALYFYGLYSVTASNVKVIKGAAASIRYLQYAAPPGYAQDTYLINADIDSWVITWDGTGTTAKLHRQYQFDAHCQDKDGNALSGVSAIGEYISPYGQAFSVTTNASGDIATQTVERSWYERPTGNTENLKTPLKVTYSKAGYETLVKYYSMAEKTKDIVVLQKVVDVILVDGKPALNLSEADSENELYTTI